MTLRGRLFAMTYDRQLAKVERAGLRALREDLLAQASGDVLEIGAGTGANLPVLRRGRAVPDHDGAGAPDAAPPRAQNARAGAPRDGSARAGGGPSIRE